MDLCSCPDAVLQELDVLRRFRNQFLLGYDGGSLQHQDSIEICRRAEKGIDTSCPQGVAGRIAMCLTLQARGIWEPSEDISGVSQLLPVLKDAIISWTSCSNANENTTRVPIGLPEVRWNFHRLRRGAAWIPWWMPAVSADQARAAASDCWNIHRHYASCCYAWHVSNPACFDSIRSFERCCQPGPWEKLAIKYGIPEDSLHRTNAQLQAKLQVRKDSYCTGLDQGCLGVGSHCYTPVFTQWLPQAAKFEMVLQIGVCWGQSLAAWADWFPQARIVGVDIEPERFWQYGQAELRLRGMDIERVHVHRGNASGSGFHAELQRHYGWHAFDAILDDGSHEHHDVVMSFRELFVHHLRPGGVYIIEDFRKAWIGDQSNFFYRELVQNSAHLRGQDFDSYQLDEFLTRFGDPDPLTIWVEAVEFRRSTLVVRKRDGYL